MKSEIVVIMDKSGSMETLRDDAIGGFNSFLEQQKNAPGEANLTLVFFDTYYQVLHSGTPIGMVAPLTRDTYCPGGMTALLDSVGRCIDEVGRRLANTPEHQRPDQVLVAIITDGHENSSRFYNTARLKEVIRHQQTKYSWKFFYLGANVDSFAEAGGLGIDPTWTTNYSHTSGGVRAAFENVSIAYTSFRGGGGGGGSLSARQADLEKKHGGGDANTSGGTGIVGSSTG